MLTMQLSNLEVVSRLGLKNIFVYSWVPYPNMIPHTVSTIKKCSYDVPVNLHALACRSNHERLQLIHVERRQTLHIELLARIFQDIHDEVRASQSDESDDGWLKGSESD